MESAGCLTPICPHSRLYEVSETVTAIHLIMEVAPGGELFAKLTEDGCYDEDHAKVIFAQIASAVYYMVSASKPKLESFSSRSRLTRDRPFSTSTSSSTAT